MQNKIKYWIDGSNAEYCVAKDIASQTVHYTSALFFLHLAVEKVLKGYFVFKQQRDAPFSHNLINLSNLAGITLSDEQKILLSEVNEFNIESRYPEEEFEFARIATLEFTESYLKKCEEFRQWILMKLN